MKNTISQSTDKKYNLSKKTLDELFKLHEPNDFIKNIKPTTPYTIRLDTKLLNSNDSDPKELRLRIAKIVNKHLKNKK